MMFYSPQDVVELKTIQLWDGQNPIYLDQGPNDQGINDAESFPQPGSPRTIYPNPPNPPISYGVGISLQFRNASEADATLFFGGTGAEFHFDY
jgi:hypothetical protein